jgi:RimJ/RimL family protein N-acetyltransferase
MRDAEYSLRPAPPELWSAIADEDWLGEEQENRKQGFGAGPRGQLTGLETLLDLAERAKGNPELQVLAIKDGATNVGFVSVEDLGERMKTAEMYVFIAPQYRRQGAFTYVVNEIVPALYKGGLYRVQGDVLRINREAITAARALGFTWESTKRQGLWMNEHPYDVATLRMLRADWKKMRREGRKEKP